MFRLFGYSVIRRSEWVKRKKWSFRKKLKFLISVKTTETWEFEVHAEKFQSWKKTQIADTVSNENGIYKVWAKSRNGEG